MPVVGMEHGREEETMPVVAIPHVVCTHADVLQWRQAGQAEQVENVDVYRSLSCQCSQCGRRDSVDANIKEFEQ